MTICVNMTQSQCGICCCSRKTLRSLSDTGESKIAYIDIILALTNIQLSREELMEDYICRSCCVKLEDAQKFKLQIENAYSKFRAESSKKLFFSNIKELEIKIEPLNIIQQATLNDYQIELMSNNNVTYKNVTITRLAGADEIKTDKKEYNNGDRDAMTLTTFLNTLNGNNEGDCEANLHGSEIDDDFHNDEDYQSNQELDEPLHSNEKKKKCSKKRKKCDDEYLPTAYKKKGKGPRHKNSYCPLKKDNGKFVMIKPQILKDVALYSLQLAYRIDPTMPRKKYVIKSKRKKYKKGICDVCGKHVSNIKIHSLVHKGIKSFKCNECDKSYHTSAGLRQHNLQHHSNETVQCNVCVAVFSNAKALERHMLVHSTEKGFACDECGKSFKRRLALRNHLMLHNSANKSVLCELCNMSFYTKYSLKHHMRVHTGERPYNCELCSQPYSYKHDFNRHCLKKHGVCFLRRTIYKLNEEVLRSERELMRDLLLKANGSLTMDNLENLQNPFTGPQGYLAFQKLLQSFKNGLIRID